MTLFSYPNDQYLHGPSIKITSPEQFVPMLIAFQQLEGIDPNSLWSSRYYPITIEEKDYMKQLTRKQLKEVAVKQLNYSYPEKYSMPVNRAYLINSKAPDMSTRYFANAFAGRGEQEVISRDYVSMPGIFYHYSRINYTSFGSSLYPSRELAKNVTPFRIKPLMLHLVKAKHIPYLRACILLEQPVALPLKDMKLMTIDNPTLTLSGAIGDVIAYSGLDSVLRVQELRREFASHETMLSYLIGPDRNKPIDQIIKDAAANYPKQEPSEEEVYDNDNLVSAFDD